MSVFLASRTYCCIDLCLKDGVHSFEWSDRSGNRLIVGEDEMEEIYGKGEGSPRSVITGVQYLRKSFAGLRTWLLMSWLSTIATELQPTSTE